MNCRFIILLILVLHVPRVMNAQAVGDFQSAFSGAWATAGNWQTWNGTAWVVPGAAPTSAAGVITILNTHTMNIAATVTIDQVVINSGGTVNWTLGTCTIANGAGVDLQIDGTFWDNRGVTGTSITFAAGATWQMGSFGTLIRSAGNSSNNWQSAYQGGIANIPSTAFWILRKTTGQNPTISTTTPASGSVYPNLIIENNLAGQWVTANTNSSFTGGGAFPTIKGNLDIGGTGTGTVSFMNNCMNATASTINGNLIVRAGSILRNFGTGLRVLGDITVNGTINFDGNSGRLIQLTGTGNQSITSTGTFDIYDLVVNKPSGVVNLNSNITVNHALTLTSGVINSNSASLLIIQEDATSSVGSNASFVNGQLRKHGDEAFNFATGDGTDWQPMAIGTATPSNFIYSENFNTGAPGWIMNVVTGPEGADPNFWDMDANEGGAGSWACGVANNGNPTLHVTSVFNPAGGAAYDAGGGCGILYCPQANRRCESPTINCTGKTNIVVSFNYIEGGEGTSDNASLWYFDGTVWAQAADMPKTPKCTTGQGAWMRYWATLPAAASNNPNVKIGFHWQNNDNGSGTDPSFAVDDVEVTELQTFTSEYFYNNPQVPYGNILAPTLTSISSCEYWILDRNSGTSGRNVTLSWDGNSCNLPSLLADFKVARYDGISTWQDEGNIFTVGTIALGAVTSVLVNNFSPFTLASYVVPLPMELVRFDAVKNNKQVDLTWTTLAEVNNDYFIIERSKDGILFEEIAQLDGAGNSNTALNYGLSDKDPSEGINYYRLKQADFDGAFTHSEVRTVYFGTEGSLEIITAFTNDDLISFYCSSETENVISLSIADMSGRIAYSGNVKCGARIDISKTTISAGVYLISLHDGTNQAVKKLVIR